MKKLFATILLLAIIPTIGVYAFSDLEKLLIAEATTPELKKIAKDYFLRKAQDQKELSEKYKTLSNLNRGGKSTSEDAERKKYKQLSEQVAQEAEKYKAQADKL
ncbi:hypothetical protein LEP1GSC058_0382 [Leptospira fainei serovar Hurstbridge str. BUT 6]|uniref:Uncharacterized protein n=1 Tax=Leptospira fainei serovar Hurstbridge str. BUT 6 TaxID=1193011 RepID=S3V679_9LEPT|nr:hypothetical protein [Leptospira fainei]EPG76164.1 hypothetical protein LEP1GSC058_0382 [Leptospira fainei serovar Hurstbridge str. BUT 6]